MLFKKMTAVYSAKHKNPINTKYSIAQVMKRGMGEWRYKSIYS
jgi:hypothetical protein